MKQSVKQILSQLGTWATRVSLVLKIKTEALRPGTSTVGLMVSVKPINFERKVHEPLNFWEDSIGTHILTLNYT